MRGRLVNEEDARFGLHELSHATLNRFRCVVHIDDLDSALTANRESMEFTFQYENAQAVLNEVFNEARQQYNRYDEDQSSKDLKARENDRNWVPERLVEHPVADALVSYSQDLKGSEPDESWMYLNVDPGTDIDSLNRSLYSRTGRETTYGYQYVARGRAERLVEFDPIQSQFSINQDHELVMAYANDPVARRLVNDFVTAEALLEIYLRDAGVNHVVIGEVLEKRDLLIRGLADAQMFSHEALGQYIIESFNRPTDLEIALVAGARSLGFVAKHIGGNGKPDGIARFVDYPGGESTITLEAKSSDNTPAASTIDFAGLRIRIDDHSAEGCLLVAPGYQGGDSSRTAEAARNNRVSCWTVKGFADIVKNAEARRISARDILEIVMESFAPQDVEERVEKLLAEPERNRVKLYQVIMKTLRENKTTLADSTRDVGMIAAWISKIEGFEDVKRSMIREAIKDIDGASHGALRVRNDDKVVINVDYDELDRRVRSLTREPGTARRKGEFGAIDK